MTTEVITISLTTGTLSKLDEIRGDVKRSNYIDGVLNRHLDTQK